VDLIKEAMAQGVVEGMQTFDQSLFELYRRGTIDFDTAIGFADSANDLRLRIKMEEVGKRQDSQELNLRLTPDTRSPRF
jgi:twitching motility protein PilU